MIYNRKYITDYLAELKKFPQKNYDEKYKNIESMLVENFFVIKNWDMPKFPFTTDSYDRVIFVRVKRMEFPYHVYVESLTIWRGFSAGAYQFKKEESFDLIPFQFASSSRVSEDEFRDAKNIFYRALSGDEISTSDYPTSIIKDVMLSVASDVASSMGVYDMDARIWKRIKERIIESRLMTEKDVAYFLESDQANESIKPASPMSDGNDDSDDDDDLNELSWT